MSSAKPIIALAIAAAAAAVAYGITPETKPRAMPAYVGASDCIGGPCIAPPKIKPDRVFIPAVPDPTDYTAKPTKHRKKWHRGHRGRKRWHRH